MVNERMTLLGSLFSVLVFLSYYVSEMLSKVRKSDGLVVLPLRFWFVSVVLLLQFAALSVQASTGFERALQELPTSKLKHMPKLLEEIASSGDERVLPLFQNWLDGKVYYTKVERRIFLLGDEVEADVFQGVDALTGEKVAQIEKASIKKIRVNNKLRKQLRAAIAELTLFSSDASLRKAAVKNMMGTLSKGDVELLETALESESNASIRRSIEVALNIAKLDFAEVDEKKAALVALKGEVHPEFRNRVEAILNSQREATSPDQALISLAEEALSAIEDKLAFYGFLERVFFGLSLGSVLLLAAIGLSITFGVMGVINMAHGELLMLGAYTTYVIQLLMPNHITMSIFVAIPVAFLVCGLVGVLIERGVIQFLKGRPLETLLATFGISLILQQTVRSIFSPLNRQVSTPEFMSGAWEINPGLALTYNRLYIIFFSLLVFTALLLIMKRTSLGLYVRAVSQNRSMAKAVGIRSEWVDAMTFGLGSGIAGVAGVALSQLTNVGPNLGQSYIIDSFMVVVFGGVGNLWGTLVAAFSLGVASKFMEPVTGTVLAQILVLVFIVLFIQRRPRGLFPQQGRAAEE